MTVPLDSPRLRDALACPSCRSPVAPGDSGLRCTACETTYPLAGAVPVLTVSGTIPPSRPSPGRFRRIVRPVLSRKFGTADLVQRFVASFPQTAILLNVGGGSQEYSGNVVNLDPTLRESVHVVGLAENLPFRDGSCDGCILQAVLEHVEDSERTLSEIHRVLVPGGRVLVDVPFIQGYHPVPRDRRRFTEEGLRAELERHGFQVEGTGVSVGPGSAMATVTAEYLALLLSGRSAGAYRLARLVTSWIALPLKYTDAWLAEHPRAHVIASSVWGQARKPA